jgi:hypothetical protein
MTDINQPLLPNGLEIWEDELVDTSPRDRFNLMHWDATHNGLEEGPEGAALGSFSEEQARIMLGHPLVKL